MQNFDLYLEPTYFIDSHHPAIVEKAHELVNNIESEVDRIKALFYYVRDSYYYSPYHVVFNPYKLKASTILTRTGVKKGYCIEKAVLFAALCRVINVPNRLIFCNVRNHIATDNVEKVLGTDLMVFHGYNEVFVSGKWVKCTVAFNKSLCDKLNVAALEFDEEKDQVFQEFDKEGGKFMVYENEYGTFHDVPYDLWVSETKRLYPHLFKEGGNEEFLLMAQKHALK
ncbi:MAG: transglutaminase domain-containing protein [Bacteroidetes bacterium]|nr:transglutaminase domain-containing protein [Bacteroidota bacterium]